MVIDTHIDFNDDVDNVACQKMNQALLFDINGLDDKFVNTLNTNQLSRHVREHRQSCRVKVSENGKVKVNLFFVVIICLHVVLVLPMLSTFHLYGHTQQ